MYEEAFWLGVCKSAADSPAFGDFLSKPKGLTNAFSFNGFGKDFKPPAPAENTLSVLAHGAGGPGQYKLTTDVSAVPDAPNPYSLGGSFESLAKQMGPATNTVRNINVNSCNNAGGCTPQYLKSLFPNINNVVQTPPGSYGLAEGSPGLVEQTFPNVSHKMTDWSLKLRNMLRSGRVDLPHQYSLNGTNWVDNGTQ